MMIGTESSLESDGRSVAIYHCVYTNEGFEHTAQALFKLVQRAQQQFPGTSRCLYLDIEGHKNSHGGFDSDMMEIQTEFLPQVLSRHLSQFSTPLVRYTNTKPQADDLPPALVISST